MLLTEEEYTRELAKDKADRLGLSCIFPSEFELFLDIDTEDSFNKFASQRDIFSALGYCTSFKESPSKSGLPHRHIIVTVPFSLSKEMRIALQACFGSDLKRELLSLDAVINNVESPTVFFESKENTDDKETS